MAYFTGLFSYRDYQIRNISELTQKEEKFTNYSASYPTENSLHLRITSVFQNKHKKFGKYIPDIVKEGDINIICINIGFMEKIAYADLGYLI